MNSIIIIYIRTELLNCSITRSSATALRPAVYVGLDHALRKLEYIFVYLMQLTFKTAILCEIMHNDGLRLFRVTQLTQGKRYWF